MIYKLVSISTRELMAPDGEVVELPFDSNTFIQLKGPLLPVNISMPSSAMEVIQTHEKQIQAVNCDALIDTGASVSVISPKIVEQLGFIETGFKPITSVHNVEVRPCIFWTHYISMGQRNGNSFSIL